MSTHKETYKSTCSYCGVGCGVLVEKDARGQVEVKGDPDHPSSQGMLCSKGMNLHYSVMNQSDRILYPEMRMARHLPRKRVSWDDATGRVANVFKSIIDRYGSDSVGMYVSGQCLTEEYYLANKLTKGFFGTNNIDTNSRLCMSSAVVGYKKTVGEDSVPISYEDIDHADCFFIAGANPAWCHPILFRRIEARKETNPDAKIIVVDPRKTQSCQSADLHLPVKPGTDTTLYLAITRLLIERDRVDHEFVDNHTEGYEALKERAFELTLEEAALSCGVDVDKIKLAADYVGDAKGLLTFWAMGLNQSAVGVQKNLALINLNLITGQIGKPGCGPFSLTGQPNAMGGREVGGLSNMLAAHRALENEDHRKEVEAFWGVKDISDKPGYPATKMIEALEAGEMKAVWIVCTNPMISIPDSNLVQKAMEKANFVVVQDISHNSDTVKYADVVLPAAGYMEKEGTMTNSERRISYLPKIVDAPGEACPDWEIFADVARKMGFHGFDHQSAEEVYLEHAALTKGTNIDVSGLDYHRLKTEGTKQWPVPTKDHPGTPRLFADNQFYTPSNKARIHAPELTMEPALNIQGYQLWITTGRIRDQWHTMTRTGKVNKLKQHIDSPYLELHPEDARKYNLKEGDQARVSNETGEVRVRVMLSEDTQEGVAFMPMHWGQELGSAYSKVNNLTAFDVDPFSKQPNLKCWPVNIEKYQKPRQKIVIVGAGAAACRFIQSYRELNEEDEIHVFSREINPFYNRVLLPDYVSEHKTWEELLKFEDEDLVNLNIHLHTGLGIGSIDRNAQKVVDDNGAEHSYDKLILGTGSRANRLPHVDISLENVYTIRQKEDADRLKSCLPHNGHVFIVGGGLLGLEMAASLRVMDFEVTVVNNTSRLMGRQLDDVGCQLLRDEVEDQGIEVILNDEVRRVSNVGEDNQVKARLRSGRWVTAHAMVMAVGTRPNKELAMDAGLTCGRGVAVNDYLQTDDPDVYAMGEIAEHHGNLYGITAAAEEQADIIARYISGDVTARYHGSVSMNILKFHDFDLCSLGNVHIPPHSPDYESITLLDENKRFYKKCVVYKDRLVGAILIGDKSEFQEYKKLIANQTELGPQRAELLRSGDEKVEVKGKLVCSCNQVGEGNIQECISEGCDSLPTVMDKTGAGTGCGSCKPEVKAILAHQEEKQKMETV